jgi:DNA-binding NtrC family response regulator
MVAGQSAKVLIIDDIPSFCSETQTTLQDAGFDAQFCTSPRQALEGIQQTPPDLVITTLVMREMSGFDVIRSIRGLGHKMPIIMVTGYGSEQAATEAVRLGASDYINKPVSTVELVARVRKGLRKRPIDSKVYPAFQLERLLSLDQAMKAVFDTVHKVAATDSRVLIEGETGTGKQLVARAIHSLSNRRSKPLVELNCAAVPEDLLESELFGHEKGSFTGATSRWVGRFEEAGQGTLFLDEIGEMGYGIQSKLLQVLQDGSFVRIGGKGAQKSGARVIAATNRDLQSEVDRGRFRADLFYRLNVISILIPPLRQRRGDISLLANLFFDRFVSPDRPARRFSSEAIEALQLYRWPGNVRELENLVEHYAILHPTEVVDVESLPKRIFSMTDEPSPLPAVQSWNYKQARAKFERSWLQAIVAASQGNMAEAARRAGMDRSQLFRMAKRHDLIAIPNKPR